jgi:hypothetical protein
LYGRLTCTDFCQRTRNRQSLLRQSTLRQADRQCVRLLQLEQYHRYR